MILACYGIPNVSASQVMQNLDSLKVSYSVCGLLVSKKFWSRQILANRGQVKWSINNGQPAWIVVADSLQAALRLPELQTDYILIICDSDVALKSSNANYVEYKDNNTIKTILKLSLKSKLPNNWKLTVVEDNIMGYVKIASKPSFLNFIQTEIYRITPYALRKNVQGLVIAYLDSNVPFKTLKSKLQSSYKLNTLLELAADSKALNLRKAVAAFKSSKNLEATALEYGVETFEILYVTRSSIIAMKAKNE